MAGARSGSGKKKSARKGPARGGARRPARPALGNDPFVRGAALRPGAPVVAVPPPELVAAAPARQAAAAPAPAPSVTRGEPASAPVTRSPAASSPSPAALAAGLRARLEALESRVESAAAGAAARLGELARQESSGEHARDLVQALSGLWPALRDRLASLDALRAALAGGGPVDAYGRDAALVERVEPVADFLYRSWWRVAVRGLEHVPSGGPVVLVANHGGALPWDALVLRTALLRDHPAHRELRPLLDARALGAPVSGPLATRLGAVAATPEHALALLAAGGAVAVFPEGSQNGVRPWPQRYRIEQFGRGGFVRLALRTGAPIVPCAIVGSEEASAPFGRQGWLSDRLGMPHVPGSALPLGLLAVLPLPSRWSLRFGEALATRELGPAAAEDREAVAALLERTRGALQRMLDEDVASRPSVFR